MQSFIHLAQIICLMEQITKEAFTIYVDQFSKFLNPSLPIGRSFIYWGLFSNVDIWLTPPFLSLVYVEFESPQARLDGPIAPQRDHP